MSGMVLCGHVFTPSPAWGALITLGGIVVVVAYLVWDRRRHPWVPRGGCNGSGVRRSKWNGKAIGACRRHRDGKHMRRRWGSGVQ